MLKRRACGRFEARSAGKNLASRLSLRGLGMRQSKRPALKGRQKGYQYGTCPSNYPDACRDNAIQQNKTSLLTR
jgi:hypothetical protein